MCTAVCTAKSGKVCLKKMKCSHCGREISAEQLEENKGLCPHCGKQPDEQLTGQQPQEQPEPNENGDAQQEQPQKPVKKRSPLPFVLGAIVLAAAAAAVITGSSPSSEGSERKRFPGSESGSGTVRSDTAERISFCRGSTKRNSPYVTESSKRRRMR